MNVAILGNGTVGSGVVNIIHKLHEEGKADIHISKILLREGKTHPTTTTCYNMDDIISDDNVDTVVEALGGIHPAYEYIKASLEAKKHVVTANKAVVCEYLEEFTTLAHDNGVAFKFEAAVAGGIPWLSSIQKAKRIDKISSFSGIFNGTSNFILHNMNFWNMSFDDAVAKAQELGYAESDPTADIDGFDVQNKVVLSAATAFDSKINMKDFPCFSMRNITNEDMLYLAMKSMSIKYIGEAKRDGDKYEASVMPCLFEDTTLEANVPSNFNIATLSGDTIGELKFYGQGAGKFPTANAVVQDIIDINLYGVATSNWQFTNKLSYDGKLSKYKYLIRATKPIENEHIHTAAHYAENYYNFTDEMYMDELMDIINNVQDNTNMLVCRMYNQ